MKTVDLLVIGAGPAGMSAATEATAQGLSTLVMDEQTAPGGQIYRSVEGAARDRLGILGEDYAKGGEIARAFRESGADYMTGALVWNIGTDRVVDYSRNGRSGQIRAGSILVATGAVERPVPIPGWTLPGVTTAGAMQIMLKSGGVVFENAVLMGSGPLLWLLAAQMVDAGCPPRAVIENLPKGRLMEAARKLKGTWAGRGYLRKGAQLMWKVRRAGVEVHSSATDLRVEGEGQAEAVAFRKGGTEHRIETASVALHQGVVPNQQITRLLRADHVWDANQHAFRPVLDETGRTSVEWLWVAGDGGGIFGAASAALQGRVAALAIAGKTGNAARLQDELRRDGAVRPFLEALYAPAPDVLRPKDETIVCRCEEVTAGQIRKATEQGAPGPNQVKSLLRTGMGPCQGRVCGLAVAQIVADTQGVTPAGDAYFRIRPPLKPIPLSELANFVVDDEEEEVAE
ncbi:FAD/NAD(P)-binding oxidoreductase [Palleronia sp. LCG004]|uniref:FAD/NAD(P)-binding oxidoreductase n=1 Tax=Palleronia sp. LCG004 TaxID=3079304 RepID=UPI0029423FE3|nr:FAD/NAD(P)-binding oxidoreductase [Palleronia sp. LCG004]WOI58247.1 FAD/NAD(P)-binding oxidoreductase [Palleronia sp. LCG004]